MFSKKKETHEKCLFCNRELTIEETNSNEVRFEFGEGEQVLGKLCNRCADALDTIESRLEDKDE